MSDDGGASDSGDDGGGDDGDETLSLPMEQFRSSFAEAE
jgi:hypothetical protein